MQGICFASAHEPQPLREELVEDAGEFFNGVMDTLEHVVSGLGVQKRDLSGISKHRRMRRDGGPVNSGLPPGWAEYTDPLTNQPFYYNEHDGVSSVSCNSDCPAFFLDSFMLLDANSILTLVCFSARAVVYSAAGPRQLATGLHSCDDQDVVYAL